MKNDVKSAVYLETSKRLEKIITGDESTIKARLANLRHGLGKIPGEDPNLWGMIFENLPETMLGRYGSPSKEEWAIYNALTLYAWHQQGKDPKANSMNKKGVSLGKAASGLVYLRGGSAEDRDTVSRRFNQLALAVDIETLTYYLRTFIPLLREKDIGLDYAMLAQDIYNYQFTTSQTSVRLKWGQDYYTVNNDKET